MRNIQSLMGKLSLLKREESNRVSYIFSLLGENNDEPSVVGLYLPKKACVGSGANVCQCCLKALISPKSHPNQSLISGLHS